MGLRLSQLHLLHHPAVGVRPRHDPGAPNLVKCLMGTDATIAKLAVGQGAFRPQGSFVNAHIAVAFWVSRAHIQVGLEAFVMVDKGCIPKDCCTSAVGAGGCLYPLVVCFLFHSIFHLHIFGNAYKVRIPIHKILEKSSPLSQGLFAISGLNVSQIDKSSHFFGLIGAFIKMNVCQRAKVGIPDMSENPIFVKLMKHMDIHDAEAFVFLNVVLPKI